MQTYMANILYNKSRYQEYRQKYQFSIDNPRCSIGKHEISIENLGFPAIFQVFRPIFQDCHILVDNPRFSIDIPSFSTENSRILINEPQ